MKGSIIGITALLILTGALLLSLAPDTLAVIVIVIMCIAVGTGFIVGILPAISYAIGMKNARMTIKETLSVQSSETWIAVYKNDSIFRNKKLDMLFREYKTKVEEQKDADEIISDIEEYISEDMLYVRTWQGLVLQIPGTLTGLGILGTFIGLITGISNIGFSSVEATLESVTMLLNGIELAFYTSISGVIFSIIFNIINRISWNVMIREHVYFVDTFHKEVIPSTEEQQRIKDHSNMKKVLARLDRIPKNDVFSLSTELNGSINASKEQALMPQIREGLDKGEFIFYLQPKVDLSNKKICGAEVLTRWKHETLGLLKPNTFMPLLEQNGYIVRLDSYIWEKVCQKIRIWIDEGMRPVPVSLNISKTDILAMDVVMFFRDMLDKYKIPPVTIELEIAKNAFVQNPGITRECSSALRRLGFKVIMDGFDGDYISVNMLENTEVDTLNLDLRFMANSTESMIGEIFDRAKKLKVEMTAECIENAEQYSVISRNGCRIGQGYYFHKPLSVEEYEAVLRKE